MIDFRNPSRVSWERGDETNRRKWAESQRIVR